MVTVSFPLLKRPELGAEHPFYGLEQHLRLSSLHAQACHGVTFSLFSTIRGDSIYLPPHHSVVLALPPASDACILHETPTYLLALSQMGKAVRLNGGEVGNL
jgi:hypothetical protein